jgi:hypothetical protein
MRTLGAHHTVRAVRVLYAMGGHDGMQTILHHRVGRVVGDIVVIVVHGGVFRNGIVHG